MTSIEDALKSIKSAQRNFGTEVIHLNESIGRILVPPIIADRDYPPFDRSAMDGYAFRFDDLRNLQNFKLIEEIHAGHTYTKKVAASTCSKIMTGAMVPEGADTVIRIEDTIKEMGNEWIRFTPSNLKKGANISKCGEDLQKDEIVIGSPNIIDFKTISLLAALGKNRIEVYKQPTVNIVSTGTEIKSVNEHVENFQIRDSNSYSIQAYLDFFKIKINKRYIVADDFSKLKETISQCLNDDLLFITGGVSAGDADFIPSILEDLGVEKYFHQVKIKPGKPVWFGVKENCTVFALPGNPFSVQVALKIFVDAFFKNCFGLPVFTPISLPLSQNKPKKTSFDEFFPCYLSEDNTSLLIKSFNGSGDISALVDTTGIGWHPAEKDMIQKDEMILFFPWNNL